MKGSTDPIIRKSAFRLGKALSLWRPALRSQKPPRHGIGHGKQRPFLTFVIDYQTSLTIKICGKLGSSPWRGNSEAFGQKVYPLFCLGTFLVLPF